MFNILSSIFGNDMSMQSILHTYGQLTVDEKNGLQKMMNDMLPSVLSKTFRITMNDSEPFRNWLSEQLKNNMTTTKIEENY